MLETKIKGRHEDIPIMDLKDLPENVLVVDSISDLRWIHHPDINLVIYPRDFDPELEAFGKIAINEKIKPCNYEMLNDKEGYNNFASYVEKIEKTVGAVKTWLDPDPGVQGYFHTDPITTLVQTLHSEDPTATTQYKMENKVTRLDLQWIAINKNYGFYGSGPLHAIPEYTLPRIIMKSFITEIIPYKYVPEFSA